MSIPVKILLVSGSIRADSTNGALVRTAHQLRVEGVATTVCTGMADLPHFNPDDDRAPLPAAVEHVRRQIGAADAILFSTPEYAGSLPGSFKNLLDWSVGGGEIYQKPVGWVNISGAPTGARGAYETLAVVLGYVGAIIIPTACLHAPLARSEVGADGLITSVPVQQLVAQALDEMRRAVQAT
ncbi:MAG TPA: NAD(P)H-dependent oxidoreductase [Acidimicrobiales bacterium]|nr:NAD(P)H-dependent oxidoreductase [Acidimicrobiales bacterium]